MKQVCMLCERTSPDGNLFCQEIYCPAEQSPFVLDYGEWLGDIEIVRSLVVLRSAAIYEVMHQKQRKYMKVAHPGAENKARLKREAEFLCDLAGGQDKLDSLPTLLPAYAGTTIKQDPYGKTMLRGYLLYFYLFEFRPGDTLREVLVKNPQLWVNHVGWITGDVAAAVNVMHRRGVYHYGLAPEGILVHFDEKKNVPQVMLLDLGIVSSKETLRQDWYSMWAPPAYTAPELAPVDGNMVRHDFRTDVFGLGLCLYEMLVGEPVYPFKLRSDEEVYRLVLRNKRVEMNRIEDVELVARIATQAVNPRPDDRQPNAADMAQQLRSVVGEPPRVKKRRQPALRTIMTSVILLLGIVFFLTLVLMLVTR
jgi:serine/threonine protein kinase